MQEVEYKIKISPWSRYRGDYGWNHVQDYDDTYELSADSIEQLYEYIASDYNQWIVKAEDRAKSGYQNDSIDNRGLDYSPIYIEVEPYSEEKRNATKAYQEVGLVRDKFIANKKKEEEAEKIRAEAWRKNEQERKDAEEYRRLKKKFGN